MALTMRSESVRITPAMIVAGVAVFKRRSIDLDFELDAEARAVGDGEMAVLRLRRRLLAPLP